MALSGQDLTEPISEGGSNVFRLTGFLGDDQRLHDRSRPFRASVPRLPYVEHNRNSISSPFNRPAADLSSQADICPIIGILEAIFRPIEGGCKASRLAAMLPAAKSSDWPPAAHAMAQTQAHGGADKPERRELRRSALTVGCQFR